MGVSNDSIGFVKYLHFLFALKQLVDGGLPLPRLTEGSLEVLVQVLHLVFRFVIDQHKKGKVV